MRNFSPKNKKNQEKENSSLNIISEEKLKQLKKPHQNKDQDKVKIKRGPAARKDLFLSTSADDGPKDLYVIKKKKRLPPWLIPLAIVIVLLLMSFVLLPLILSNRTTVPEETRVTKNNSNENKNIIAKVGDRVVVKNSSCLLFSEADKNSEHVSELLFNESVKLLDTSRQDWLAVELDDGLKGYIDRTAVTADLSSISDKGAVMKLIVRDPFKRIMSHARGGTLLIEAPMGSVLYADYQNGSLLRIKLPGGDLGWINTQGVFLLEIDQDMPIPDPFMPAFLSTAMSFENIPLIPAGQTKRGVSLAGAVRLSAKLNGVDLPRTAEQMMRVGENVDLYQSESSQIRLELARPGDLFFFHKKSNDQELDRMALCLEDNQLLINLNNNFVIEIIDMQSDIAQELSQRIMAVRRINIESK